jgi:Arc/MetJ-type ribon-helix-helix transcriptional regulator
MARKPRRVFVGALPLSSLPQLDELLAPFLGDKGSRGHVVMVRLGDDSVARLDDLVESGILGSRSEAAAFLVGAGIQAQRELFERIAMQTSEIKRLRTSLREVALAALGAAGGPGTPAVDVATEEEGPDGGRPRRGPDAAAAAATPAAAAPPGPSGRSGRARRGRRGR